MNQPFAGTHSSLWITYWINNCAQSISIFPVVVHKFLIVSCCAVTVSPLSILMIPCASLTSINKSIRLEPFDVKITMNDCACQMRVCMWKWGFMHDFHVLTKSPCGSEQRLTLSCIVISNSIITFFKVKELQIYFDASRIWIAFGSSSTQCSSLLFLSLNLSMDAFRHIAHHPSPPLDSQTLTK